MCWLVTYLGFYYHCICTKFVVFKKCFILYAYKVLHFFSKAEEWHNSKPQLPGFTVSCSQNPSVPRRSEDGRKGPQHRVRNQTTYFDIFTSLFGCADLPVQHQYDICAIVTPPYQEAHFQLIQTKTLQCVTSHCFLDVTLHCFFFLNSFQCECWLEKQF